MEDGKYNRNESKYIYVEGQRENKDEEEVKIEIRTNKIEIRTNKIVSGFPLYELLGERARQILLDAPMNKD